jgi:hypothetical protein
MEAILSSETSVYTISKRRHTPVAAVKTSNLLWIKLLLSLIKHHAMKTYGGIEEHLVFLISAIGQRCGQLHAPAALPSGKEPPEPIQ